MLVYQKNTVVLLSCFEYPFEVCDHDLKRKQSSDMAFP